MELSATIPLTKIKKIELYQNTKKLYMSQIKAQTGADYIINGGIYSFKTFKPFCNIKINGTIVGAPGYSEYGFSWNVGPDISYERLPSNDKNYIGCVGMILNGEKQKMTYNADMAGTRQRSAIATDGQNLFLYTCNGVHSKSIEKLQTFMLNKGMKNALCLDGGGSTQMTTPTKVLNSPENNGKGRIVQNYILVYTSDTKPTTITTCPYLEPSTLIKSGSRGEGAKWVQWQLNRVMKSNLVVDGIFGAKSVNALKSFQTKMGLTADGICGPATRTKLKGC